MSEYKRIIVIGVTHGEFKKLKALLKTLKFNPQERPGNAGKKPDRMYG